MKYKSLDEIIKAKLVERCVSKYLAGYSQYVREEAIQYCWLKILESHPDRAQCLECWVIAIVRKQCTGSHSDFNRDILRYERQKIRNKDGGDVSPACAISDDE